MNLKELIHKVWEHDAIIENGIRKSDIKIVIEVFIEEVKNGLIEHGKVKIKGLFTLDLRKSKGRSIRNFQGELMKSKDYYKVGLKPSQDLKERLVNLIKK